MQTNPEYVSIRGLLFLVVRREVVVLGIMSKEYRLLGDKPNEKKYMDKAYILNLTKSEKLSQLYGYVSLGEFEFANGNYNAELKTI